MHLYTEFWVMTVLETKVVTDLLVRRTLNVIFVVPVKIFLNIFRVVNPRPASQIWHAVKAPHHSSQSVRRPHQRSWWAWCTTPQQDVSLWRSSKASISKTWLPTSHPVSTLERFSVISVIFPKSSEECKNDCLTCVRWQDKVSLCIEIYVDLHHVIITTPL